MHSLILSYSKAGVSSLPASGCSHSMAVHELLPPQWLSFPIYSLNSSFKQYLHHTLPVFSPVHSFLFSSSYTHLFVSQSLCTCLLSNSPHVVSLYLQKWLIPVSLARQSSPVSKIHSLYQVLFPTHLFQFFHFQTAHQDTNHLLLIQL